MEEFIKQAWAFAFDWAPGVIGAIITLIIGFWIAGRISRIIGKSIEKQGSDATLSKFLKDLVSVLLKALVVIAAAGMIGIETTSFIAVLGAAGLAIGLALQGSLANLAGGVMILLFRPFKVGDLISAQGHTGHVTALNVFITTLRTPDHKTVIIPNGALSNGDMTNFSTLGKLRVDLVIGIGYSEDIQQARQVIMEVMKNHPMVLNDPAPSVEVLELGGSSVNLAVRPYTNTPDYWTVYFQIQEQSKVALDIAGIEIPFPQRVVHHVNPIQ